MVFAIILGIVEGLTEFLPISSTAHLLIVAKFFQISQTEYWKFFEVFIQSGAILAVVVVFYKQLLNKQLWPKILASFLPTAIIGFLLHKIIKTYFFGNYLLIAFSLIIISLVFFWVEYLIKSQKIILNKEVKKISFKEAIVLGLAQSLAVIPGISRAGIVLVTGLSFGYKREEVAMYSFILAVPTILSASVFDLLKTNQQVLWQNLNLSFLGFLVAFISAYLAVSWFIKYLQKNNLVGFAVYRIILAILVLIFLLK